ncbi:Ribose-phosphate pyrophosphokinase [Babesia sp. Xinjiang]|uniref:Ribose-phosphate pyrophosphokinase n=1 Tax=Babesia sp. Xinjiang TaxID=462227 RepID=UPI000A237464|nr:Ribose-phosphate pyrophosphokinase [Babesia sp. Xinjiang]ORM42029.1 Ribose-phosphate pyrophosphokinase [Babesia sp. Xinjiang]
MRMESKNSRNPLVFTGNWNRKLVSEVCAIARLPLGKADVSNFSDGETKVDLQEELGGSDVIFIQSTSPPVNSNLLELLFMISAASRSGAKHITAIIPYFGYSRQDRKTTAGSNISASDVARMLELFGVNRIVSFDLHSTMCQGFFGPKVQVDNKNALGIFVDYLDGLERVSIVSPDAGAYSRSMQLYKMLADHYPHYDISSAMIFKQRVTANHVENAVLCGNVTGCDVIIVDDIVDTAGTLCKASELLMANGAKSVIALITHGIFSGPALQRIRDSPIARIVTTDSICHSEAILSDPKIQVVSLCREIAAIVGSCIGRTQP